METGMELVAFEEKVTVEPPRLGRAYRLRNFIRRVAEAAVAALNGLAGDYLEKEGLFLATPMGFVSGGRSLSLTREAFAEAFPGASGKVAVFVHGLCCTETAFTDPCTGEHFGHCLSRDLGHTALFVRYNSGLALAENGRRLAELLDRLPGVWPTPVTEILPVGHSMGGLVIRGALAHGMGQGHSWLSRVPRVILLGSPHLGAPLEKLVHLFTRALRAVRHPVATDLADFLDIRSVGIKDLRHGLPAPGSAAAPSVEHCLAAAVLARPGHAVNWLFGDGMVREESALGLAPGGPAPVRHGVFHHMGHFALARRPEVYGQIREWCVPGLPSPRETLNV